MLEKYFNLTITPIDSTDRNTIYAPSFFATVLTYMVNSQIPRLSSNTLNGRFLKELQEYSDAIIGDKKLLGVLVRGTDYIKSKFKYRPLYTNDLIKTIEDRIEEFKYDCIFLATEDKDYYEVLSKAFKHKIITVSQERYSVNDFTKSNLISELEVEKTGSKDYDALVEDNTVNYIYALYMLSKCESFLCTSQYNGAEMARAFNCGKYTHDEILTQEW